MAQTPKTSNFEHTRKFVRISFSDTPWVLNLRPAPELPSDQLIRLEAKNISLGGIKLLSNYKLPLFQPVQLQLFEKKSRAEAISLTGTVVRVEETDTGLGEKTFGLALEFKSLDSAAFERLAKVLPRPTPPRPA